MYSAFLALVEDIGREVDRLSLQGRLSLLVNGVQSRSAHKLLGDLMKKGLFSYRDVEPLDRILRDIVPHMVGPLKEYQKYRDGKWSGVSVYQVLPSFVL